MRITVNHFY